MNLQPPRLGRGLRRLVRSHTKTTASRPASPRSTAAVRRAHRGRRAARSPDRPPAPRGRLGRGAARCRRLGRASRRHDPGGIAAALGLLAQGRLVGDGGAGTRREPRRGLRRQRPERRLQPAPPRALSDAGLGERGTPVLVLTKADLCDDVGAALLEVEQVALGVATHAVSNVTGEGLDELAPYLAPAQDCGAARLLGSRQVDPRQPPGRRGAAGDERDRRGRPRPAHDDQPSADPAAGRAPCWWTPRACARSSSGTQTTASRRPSRTSTTSPPTAASTTAHTRASRVAPYRPRSTRAGSRASGSQSYRAAAARAQAAGHEAGRPPALGGKKQRAAFARSLRKTSW